MKAVESHGSRLDVDYFDGTRPQPHAVQMWVEQGMLQLAGKDVIRQVPLGMVRWPNAHAEQTPRTAQLVHGGKLCAHDSARWDHWFQTHQSQLRAYSTECSSVRWAAVAVSLLLAVSAWGYGGPWHLRP